MSGVNGSNQTPPGSGNHPLSLPLGMPPPHHLLPSREQEMIQNDLYRRAVTDPALAQQVRSCNSWILPSLNYLSGLSIYIQEKSIF